MMNSKTYKNYRGGNVKPRLPQLKKKKYDNPEFEYRLVGAKSNAKQRRKALDNIIKYEAKKNPNKTIRKAATAKKARLNVLRIYRRNKNIKTCRKITSDMRYIDKKYRLGKTKKIC